MTRLQRIQKQNPDVCTTLLGCLLVCDAIDQLREALKPTPKTRLDETMEQFFYRTIAETMQEARNG